MSTTGYQIRDQFAVHFLTFAIVQWVDVFTRSLHVIKKDFGRRAQTVQIKYTEKYNL